jgi:CRP-like cAMP-binding protein
MPGRDTLRVVVQEGFLACLSVGDREALESLGNRRHFGSGQVLFSEGDDGHGVVVILDGTVKIVTVAQSGREIILDVLDAGSLVGELSAIDGEPRSATAIAVTAVDVLIVPTAQFLTFLEDHGGAATALLQLLVGRLRRTSQRQLEFGTGDALSRICVCVLEMLDRYATHDRTQATIPFAQHDIAAMTGLSREAVVKGLRALRLLGWLELRARELTVLDEAAIRARAAL